MSSYLIIHPPATHGIRAADDVVMVVCKIRGKIIRTVLCCIVNNRKYSYHHIRVLTGKRCFSLRFVCIFTARSYARAVLGVVILSARLSHAWIVTKLNDAVQIFLYRTKGQSLCYSDTKSCLLYTSPSPRDS